jgi:hypothetical protein
MEKILMNHIALVRSCMNRGKFDPKKVEDVFAFEIAITAIDRSIAEGTLTEKQFKDMVLLKKKKSVRKKK